MFVYDNDGAVDRICVFKHVCVVLRVPHSNWYVACKSRRISSTDDHEISNSCTLHYELRGLRKELIILPLHISTRNKTIQNALCISRRAMCDVRAGEVRQVDR